MDVRWGHLRKNNHCQPFIPPCPPNFKIPEARSGLIALPPNIPKKKIATLFANSRFVYQVDKVYIAPGIYPASHRPRKARETRKPVRFFMKTCMVATNPKTKT